MSDQPIDHTTPHLDPLPPDDPNATRHGTRGTQAGEDGGRVHPIGRIAANDIPQQTRPLEGGPSGGQSAEIHPIRRLAAGSDNTTIADRPETPTPAPVGQVLLGSRSMENLLSTDRSNELVASLHGREPAIPDRIVTDFTDAGLKPTVDVLLPEGYHTVEPPISQDSAYLPRMVELMQQSTSGVGVAGLDRAQAEAAASAATLGLPFPAVETGMRDRLAAYLDDLKQNLVPEREKQRPWAVDYTLTERRVAVIGFSHDLQPGELDKVWQRMRRPDGQPDVGRGTHPAKWDPAPTGDDLAKSDAWVNQVVRDKRPVLVVSDLSGATSWTHDAGNPGLLRESLAHRQLRQFLEQGYQVDGDLLVHDEGPVAVRGGQFVDRRQASDLASKIKAEVTDFLDADGRKFELSQETNRLIVDLSKPYHQFSAQVKDAWSRQGKAIEEVNGELATNAVPLRIGVHRVNESKQLDATTKELKELTGQPVTAQAIDDLADTARAWLDTKSDRTALEAARDRALDEVNNQLAAHGVRMEIGQSAVGGQDRLGRTVTDLAGHVTDPVRDELVAATREWLDASLQVRVISEEIGMAAGRDLVGRLGGDLLIGEQAPGANSFDILGYDPVNRRVIVVEAKGGSSPRGHRKVPLGNQRVPAEQGSGPYLTDTFNVDSRMPELYRQHPHLLEGVQRGDIAVEYYHVQQEIPKLGAENAPPPDVGRFVVTKEPFPFQPEGVRGQRTITVIDVGTGPASVLADTGQPDGLRRPDPPAVTQAGRAALARLAHGLPVQVEAGPTGLPGLGGPVGWIQDRGDGTYELRLNDRLPAHEIRPTVAHLVTEFLAAQNYAAGRGLPLDALTARSHPTDQTRLSPHDLGRLAELNTLAEDATDPAMAADRDALRARFASLAAHLGLVAGTGEPTSPLASIRRGLADRHELLSPTARQMLESFPSEPAR